MDSNSTVFTLLQLPDALVTISDNQFFIISHNSTGISIQPYNSSITEQSAAIQIADAISEAPRVSEIDAAGNFSVYYPSSLGGSTRYKARVFNPSEMELSPEVVFRGIASYDDFISLSDGEFLEVYQKTSRSNFSTFTITNVGVTRNATSTETSQFEIGSFDITGDEFDQLSSSSSGFLRQKNILVKARNGSGFVVAYRSLEDVSDELQNRGYVISTQSFDATYQALDSRIILSTGDSEAPQLSAIEILADGRHVVVSSSVESGKPRLITVDLRSAALEYYEPPIQNEYGSLGVLALQSGFVTYWLENNDRGGINASFVLSGSEIVHSIDYGSKTPYPLQGSLSASLLPNGDFLMNWKSGSEIYSQRYNSSGKALSRDGQSTIADHGTNSNNKDAVAEKATLGIIGTIVGGLLSLFAKKGIEAVKERREIRRAEIEAQLRDEQLRRQLAQIIPESEDEESKEREVSFVVQEEDKQEDKQKQEVELTQMEFASAPAPDQAPNNSPAAIAGEAVVIRGKIGERNPQ